MQPTFLEVVLASEGLEYCLSCLLKLLSSKVRRSGELLPIVLSSAGALGTEASEFSVPLDAGVGGLVSSGEERAWEVMARVCMDRVFGSVSVSV